jgi:hypothetical protein
MATTHATATTEAEAVRLLAEKFLKIYDELVGLLDHNSALSIDWGNATKPAFLEEDADGNLSGLPITRQQVANAIGSFDALQTLLTGGTLAAWQHPANHLGNLNLVARPAGKR